MHKQRLNYTARLENICVYNSENSEALLNKISFTINPGSIIAVHSVNSDETNALLRVLSGQLKPDHGRINWSTVPTISKHRDRLPVISTSFFENDYYPELTLYDNLYLGAYEFNYKKIFKPAQLIINAREQYDELDCAECWNKGAQPSSYEQRINASLVRGYVRDANVYVFDHVISGLLPNVRARFIKKSKEKSKRGVSTIFSLEKLSMEIGFASHVLLLNQGELVFFGPADSLTVGQIKCITASRITLFRDAVIAAMEEIFRVSDGIEMFIENMLDLIWSINNKSSVFVCYQDLTGRNKLLYRGLSPEAEDINMIDELIEHNNDIEKLFICINSVDHRLTPLLHINPFKVNTCVDYLGISIGFADDRKMKVLSEEFEHYFTKFINELNLKSLKNQGDRLELLGSLSGEIVHDLNNSLFSILGSVQLIKLKNSNPDIDQHIDVINEVIAESQNLSNKLLSFSKKGLTEFKSLNIHEILKHTIMVARNADNKTVQIKKSFQDAEIFVNGDCKELQIAFLNILQNSIEAVDPYSGQIVIETFSIENEISDVGIDGKSLPESAVGVSFRDNGRGISSEDVKHIFDPFFTTSEDEQDAGLGLAIAYGSIKEHKGNITVQSDQYLGSQFTVYLPLHINPVVTNPDAVTKGKYIDDSKKHKILICDDNKHVRDVMRKMLKSLGYGVLIAADAAECLAQYSQNSGDIDIILLDDIMPNMTGRECFYELKKLDQNVKVVIITGYRLTNYPQQIFKDGLCDILKKPITIDQLSRCLNDYNSA